MSFPKGAPQIDPEIFGMGIPVLGICYGMQLMAYHLGGAVEYSDHREYGAGTLNVVGTSPLFDGLPSKLQVWNSHGDKITRIPQGFDSDRNHRELRLTRRFNIAENYCSDSSFIRRLHTRLWARTFSKTFSTEPAIVRPIGRWVLLSSRLAAKSAEKFAMTKSCSVCPAASIPQSLPLSFIARSATN